MSQSAIDTVFEQRWSDVVELVSAFQDFEKRALAGFENTAGPTVQLFLADKGFDIQVLEKWGEFCAYRQDWKKADGEPGAKLAIGGLLPKGLANVEAESPYLWVYLRLDKPWRAQAAEYLRNGIGAGDAWLHPETNDRQPLGRYLTVSSEARMKFVRDPVSLAAFVQERFPEILALEELVSRALRSVPAAMA